MTEQSTIRVLLVDDQYLVRHGLRFIINAQQDMEVIGEAGNGREAVRLASELKPHVVFMDVQMEDGADWKPRRLYWICNLNARLSY